MYFKTKTLFSTMLALTAIAGSAATPDDGTSAGAGEATEAQVTLAPDSDLGKAFHAILPFAGIQEFFTAQQQVVLTDGISGQHLLVKCTTETLPSRRPLPVTHFLGCVVAPTDDLEAGIPHWTLMELLSKTAAASVAATQLQVSTPPCNPHSRLGCD